LNGSIVAWASGFVTDDLGNRFIFSILAPSASYIAAPAAMRPAATKADPGLHVPMAPDVAVPFNITLAMPLFLAIIEST
jgi:uncharacterized protein